MQCVSHKNIISSENAETAAPRPFTVLMPVFNQCGFVRRAVSSLFSQTYAHWELIIINDGSTDALNEFIADYLTDSRIKYIENPENYGLGYALNRGLDAASYDLIAYLPADDFFYENHLQTLADALAKPEVALAFTGIRFDDSKDSGFLDYKTCKGAIPGYCTQLVQVAHRKTADRWTEREECVSEDLFYLFWRKLTGRGAFAPCQTVTCEWCCHPNQRHKICGERYGGGLNKYRAYYGVKQPIRFRSGKYKMFDEVGNYAPYRNHVVSYSEGLKILLVGELAYNPERIYALERSGHRLYGLWAQPRFGYSTVGHLPFGNVEDVPYENWRERVKEINPDVVYALLSTSAIEIAHEVLMADTGIPFVWHFKEGPQEAQKAGLWDKLITLYARADGRIYLNAEEKRWIEQFIPPVPEECCLLLDGDMPLADSFSDRFSPKLSASDGEIHTVVAGRVVGLSPNDYAELARNGIHLHVYSENLTPDEASQPFLAVDRTHFHIHNHCPQHRWTEEFSQYDAGWLHCVDGGNDGNVLKMTWADMNLPARISTYLVAGIPMIQKRNASHIFAQRSYVGGYGMDICYDTITEVVDVLKDQRLMAEKVDNVLANRHRFSFDANVETLTGFFRRIISNKKV